MKPRDGWQPLGPADVPEVVRIAEQIHPGLPERPEVFAEKIRLAPGFCRKLVRDGACAGYGLAHPWTLTTIPRMDAFLERLPQPADCLYIHDIAILPTGRGGASTAYLAELKTTARRQGIPALALTSVYGTTTLWSRFGFIAQTIPDAAGKLRAYGPSAVYMVCREP